MRDKFRVTIYYKYQSWNGSASWSEMRERERETDFERQTKHRVFKINYQGTDLTSASMPSESQRGEGKEGVIPPPPKFSGQIPPPLYKMDKTYKTYSHKFIIYYHIIFACSTLFSIYLGFCNLFCKLVYFTTNIYLLLYVI